MNSLVTLCTSLTVDPEAIDIKVLTEVLRGISSHDVFKSVEDEMRNKYVKLINHLLNEPKTRPLGLLLLENFAQGVDSKQLVGIQEQLVSTVQLVGKSLDLQLAHKVVVVLLPLCQKLPELNTAAISSVLPKVFSKFSEVVSTELPSQAEFLSVIACLERYRGPSGVYRSHLEKSLVKLIDVEMDEPIAALYAKLWPLFSATGGGGNNGEKHSDDWNKMLMKLLKELYDVLLYLLSDLCPLLPGENPLAGETSGLDLPAVASERDENVLSRITKAVRRVLTLGNIITAYLKTFFPAPKVVPLSSILQAIYIMWSSNPTAILNGGTGSVTTEISFISCLLPQIIACAFQMLDGLLYCVESSIYTELSPLEFQIFQQFKWISEASGQFEYVKLEMYRTTNHLLRICRGSLSVQKSADMMATYALADIVIARRKVAINMNSKTKRKKNLTTLSLNSIDGDSETEWRSCTVCNEALKVLQQIIPELSSALFFTVYQTLVRTITDFQRSADFPAPYSLSSCRREALNTLLCLALNPHRDVPVSIAVVVSLVEQSCKDSCDDVSSSCFSALGKLERVVHPTRVTLEFPFSLQAPGTENDVIDVDMETTLNDCIGSPEVCINGNTGVALKSVSTASCQTTTTTTGTQDIPTAMDIDAMRSVVAEAFKANISEIIMRLQSHTAQPRENLRARLRHQSNDSEATVLKDQDGFSSAIVPNYVNGNNDYASDTSFEDEIHSQTLVTTPSTHVVKAKDLQQYHEPDESEEEYLEDTTALHEKENEFQLRVNEILVDFDDDTTGDK